MALSQLAKVSILIAVFALLGVGCSKNGTQSPAPNAEPRADAGSVVEQSDAGDAIPEGWQWYVSEENGYRIAYPGDWQVREYPEDPLIVDLIAPDNPAAPGFEPIGDISVVVRENPEGLIMEQFYDGQRQANLFADAQGGIRERETDGIPSRVFTAVIGKITANIAVVPMSDVFLEIAFTRSDLDPALFERFLDHLQVRR